jgi:rhamnogalacturonan endolyase
MYGSCAFDDDGYGLWTTGLGHGDANHVGKFLPDREGMQVYHCLESGKTQVALHDAKTGATIWNKVGSSDNDMGRCMVADIDSKSPGCEFWMYGNRVYSQTGADLGYECGSCNMGIWFDGTLTRQLIDGDKMDGSLGRTFTLYRYDISYNNGTKKNPAWYGDFLGDWREEIIMPDASKLKDIKIFSTWYPSSYKLPWLMTDHTYYMGCINQNVGYNQPNNIGAYFLGTGMDFDKVPLAGNDPTVISSASTDGPVLQDNRVFNLNGQEIMKPSKPGIYVKNGRKQIVR